MWQSFAKIGSGMSKNLWTEAIDVLSNINRRKAAKRAENAVLPLVSGDLDL